MKILIELKRLFAFLQRSEAKSYNTTKFVDACRSLDLTNDVLSQNDTAEFCDKLVDRLEDSLSDTWRIFTGSILHEMDFLGVPFRSEKSQKFACLQLPIIGVANASLKESLAAFVKPEKMEGENQVECQEAANAKFDALRRDWLAELPELFDCPFETMGIRLSDVPNEKEQQLFAIFPWSWMLQTTPTPVHTLNSRVLQCIFCGNINSPRACWGWPLLFNNQR